MIEEAALTVSTPLVTVARAFSEAARRGFGSPENPLMAVSKLPTSVLIPFTTPMMACTWRSKMVALAAPEAARMVSAEENFILVFVVLLNECGLQD